MKNIIQEYISDFNNKKNYSYIAHDVFIPIVWFGDIEAYQTSPKKIITIGLNPSLREFSEKRFDIIDLTQQNATDKLVNTLNSYFKVNPYKQWFNFFEKVLHPLDASYYEKKATNTVIHIDIYSAIATDPTWGRLSSEQKQEIQNLDLFKKLLDLLNPDIILFSANEQVFNEVFCQFEIEQRFEDINGKRGIFIRKYTKDNKILISGRNMNGQPFCGLQDSEIQEIMTNLKS